MKLREVVVAVCVLAGIATSGLARETDDEDKGCRVPVDLTGVTALPNRVPIEATKRNTLVFDHLRLHAVGDHPFVLEADDGGYFQVLFMCTAPQYFEYSITADDSTLPNVASSSVLPGQISASLNQLWKRSVTMRHSAAFFRYRVTVRLREGLQFGQQSLLTRPFPPRPPRDSTTSEPVTLYSLSFDVWLVTKPEWKLGIIGGVAGSKLTDTKYSIVTDTDGKKTFEENATQDSGHADVMALAHAYYSKTYWRTLNLGMAFGLGTSGTSPRYFIGPSVVFGKYFVLTGGKAFGWVDAPPVGQKVGAAPVNGDNTLNSLSKRFTSAWYFGIGFTWVNRTDQFAAALTAASSSSGAVGSCVTSVKPETLNFDAKGVAVDEANKPVAVTVEAGDDCFWTATVRSTGDFKVKENTGSGKGKGSVVVSAAPSGEKDRSDYLEVIGPFGSKAKLVKLTQGKKPESCVTSVKKDNDATGGKQVFHVKAKSDCKWRARLDPPDAFVLDKSEGTGDGDLVVTPPQAGDVEVTATLNIEGPEGADPLSILLKQEPKKK